MLTRKWKAMFCFSMDLHAYVYMYVYILIHIDVCTCIIHRNIGLLVKPEYSKVMTKFVCVCVWGGG